MADVSRSWSALVPVKHPDLGKSRLADAVGDLRPALARAFALDTVAVLLASDRVLGVHVVTDDAEVTAGVLALGAAVVPDAPAGLNEALRYGATALPADRGSDHVVAVQADLPALRVAELDAVLDAALEHEVSFVPDAIGIGTTMYAVRAAALFDPHFGGRSRAAHRQTGAVEISPPSAPGVHRDVDTAVDLWDARRLGVGPRTAAALEQLG